MTGVVNDSIFQGYAYDYTALPPLAMQQGLPPEELPALDWIWKTTLVALRILSNELLGDFEKTSLTGGLAHLDAPSTNEFVDLIRGIWGRLLAATPSERPRTLADYATQFRTIALPASANVLFEDDAFAWWRVAGPNPTVIVRATQAGELTNDRLRSIAQFANDDLEALIAAGRLVVADYRAPLADLENGANGGVPKFAYKPVAWFGVPAGSQKLVPLAIQPGDGCGVRYVPPPGAESWPWRAAKTIVSSADTNHHELIAHLGRTHLFVEPFIVATHLALADSHPVSLLLRPHFEGTIFINWAAVRFLINNGGGVDHLLAGTIESSRQVAVGSVTGMTFDDAIIPRALARRGFGGPVPFSFPYRDDALAVWAAIRDWVASYLAIFFTSDAAVRNDDALQAWARLVRAQDGGRVASFPALESVDTLVGALAAIIFAASAQHAAVNFPQATVMVYTPTMPGAGYGSVADAIASGSEAQWLRALPPLDMAALQLRITHALGGVHYTQLGGYAQSWFHASGQNMAVQQRLAAFRHALAEIEASIKRRNARLPAAFQYAYLLPSQIPQSINI